MVCDNFCCGCGGFNDVIRSWKIWFAGAKTNNGTASCFEGLRLCIDSQGRRLGDSGDSCGNTRFGHGRESSISGLERELDLEGVPHLHFLLLALA